MILLIMKEFFLSFFCNKNKRKYEMFIFYFKLVFILNIIHILNIFTYFIQILIHKLYLTLI